MVLTAMDMDDARECARGTCGLGDEKLDVVAINTLDGLFRAGDALNLGKISKPSCKHGTKSLLSLTHKSQQIILRRRAVHRRFGLPIERSSLQKRQ